MSDDLAKAIHAQIETARVTTDPDWDKASWEELPEWYQEALRKGANAAREFYGLPESVQKGAAGKVVALLRDVQSKYDICNLDYYSGYAKGGIDLALRALGVEAT